MFRQKKILVVVNNKTKDLYLPTQFSVKVLEIGSAKEKYYIMWGHCFKYSKIGENDFSSNERVEPLKDKKLFYGRQGWTGDDRQKSRLQWSQTFYEVILQAALNLRCQCGDS